MLHGHIMGTRPSLTNIAEEQQSQQSVSHIKIYHPAVEPTIY